MQFNLVRRESDANLTAVVNGALYVADETRTNFESLVNAAVANDEAEFLRLYDASIEAAKRFEVLSERVTVANSRVLIDGDEIDDVLSDQVVRFLDEDVDDWQSLVNFLEKVYTNTDEHTRSNLFRWLNSVGSFTISDNGNIIGYKGLNHNGTSIHRGPAVVNGEAVNGNVPNEPGSVVEMQRSAVTHDPGVGCAAGLHVGTWDYARGFGHIVAEVEVNPRDVVSVPTDCGGQKMRVARYNVVRYLDQEYKEAVVPSGVTAAEDFDTVEEAYDQGYEDGYNDGLLDG